MPSHGLHGDLLFNTWRHCCTNFESTRTDRIKTIITTKVSKLEKTIYLNCERNHLCFPLHQDDNFCWSSKNVQGRSVEPPVGVGCRGGRLPPSSSSRASSSLVLGKTALSLGPVVFTGYFALVSCRCWVLPAAEQTHQQLDCVVSGGGHVGYAFRYGQYMHSKCSHVSVVFGRDRLVEEFDSLV